VATLWLWFAMGTKPVDETHQPLTEFRFLTLSPQQFSYGVEQLGTNKSDLGGHDITTETLQRKLSESRKASPASTALATGGKNMEPADRVGYQ